MATIRELRAQFTAGAKGLMTSVNKVKKEISDLGPTTEKSVDRANRSYKDLVSETDKLKQAIDESNDPKAFDRLNKAIDQTQKEFKETGQVGEQTMSELRSAINESGSGFDQLSADGRQAISQIERSVGGLENDLKQLGKDTGLDEVNTQVQELGENIQETGSSENVGLFAALGGAIGGLRGKAVLAGAGIAGLAGSILSSISVGSEFTGAMNNLEIQTGATDDELKEMEQSLKNIYQTGAGESFNDIADAMATVRSATKLTGDELEDATQIALTLRDAFDWDVDELMRSVRGMMTNFNLSAEESFTLLAQGRQEMGSSADDLLDTFNEYGHAFADLGFSGEEAMNMIMNSMEAGVRNTDIAADAVNEFATRIMDGSDTTAEALQMAGLNTDEIINKFKQGGPEAASAFQEVTQAIGDIGDASIQEQAAVGLFGSMAEDVGVEAVLALGNVEGAADKAGDTLEEINEIKYSTIGEAIQGIWRGIQTNLLLPLQSKAMPYINTFVSGIRDAFGALFALFSGDEEEAFNILERMGLSSGQVQMMINAVNLIQDALNRIKGAILGFMGYVQAEDGSWVPPSFYGESNRLVEMITDAFNKVRDFIQPALEEIWSFIQDVVGRISTYWQENGSQIMTAVGNAFDFISNIIQTVMPVVLAIIKTVWGSIKNVINGALDVIMGAVNIFTGLFTGDFSKMWEGVKQLFFGAIELIWGWINLTFFGRIVKGAKTFITAFSGGIRSLWQGVVQFFRGGVTSAWELIRNGWNMIWNATRTVFTNVWNFLKNTWNSIRSITSGAVNLLRTGISKGWNFISKITTTVFRGIWNFLQSIWNTVSNFVLKIVSGLINGFRTGWNRIYNTTKSVFTNVWSFLRSVWNRVYNFIRDTILNLFNRIKNTWDNIYNSTRNIFTNVFNFLRRTWRNIYNGVRDRVSSIFKRVRDTWRDLRERTTEIFNNIKDRVTGTFDDIITAAKELPGRIKTAFTDLANTMLDWLGKGVNGVIGGVNWVMDKLSIDFKISEWPVPQYAHGTDGHPGGPMIVGDGKGSNAGSELVITPDGKQYLSPGKPTLTWGPEGTHVIPAKLTKELLEAPRYAFGTIKDGIKSGFEKVKSGISNVAGKIKDTAVGIWEYIQEPSKLLDIALETIGVELPTNDTTIGKMAVGGFNLVKEKAVEFIKGKIDDFLGGGDAPAGSFGTGVARWTGVARQALLMTGQYTEANLQRLLYQMQTESGGNPAAINLWDSNARRGTPSKGLMQVIDPTFAAYKMPGYNNIWNPLDNILASIRYAVSRYGSLARAYRGVGYEKGGFIDKEHLAMLGENDKDEVVIPLEQHRSRAIGLWQEAGRRLGISDQTMAVLYNSQNGVVEKLQQLASLLVTQTQEIIKQNPLLGRVVNNVNLTRNALSTQLMTTTQAFLMKIDQTEKSLSNKIDEMSGTIKRAYANTITSIQALEIKVGQVNKTAKQALEKASKATTDAVKKARKELIESLPRDSFERNSLESPNRGKPGYVQAEDGSWVHGASFYGYADGGIVTSKQLAWIAEGGWAESIISHDPAKRVSQQRIWQQTGDMLGFTGDEQNKEALSFLRRIAEAVESGDGKLLQLLNKQLTVIMDHVEVGRIMDKEQGRRTGLNGRVAQD